jgi:hypothetical protein
MICDSRRHLLLCSTAHTVALKELTQCKSTLSIRSIKRPAPPANKGVKTFDVAAPVG